ncbi:TonB-dependent hemoglobin/transferrin/lactoferrin family receptor [Phenylobacterium sp.]|uniref:TonB-dependent hemoglobin/transferrin/lactoferrin family receptor n=1 Tax=Phenylobacterium sp. TaxID=1871053 RepID=UPI00272F368A|nr:TonB-dependent hemoglobin/transferrin/lactoferrin family receptor [Phenylobacterium sp.]MDP2212941.1 TonB-dependent hemoglobin/transferrin/lactoferrin family receptor [Phenylobacterium sp.]
MLSFKRASRRAWFMGVALAALGSTSAADEAADPLQLAATTVTPLTVTATRQARPTDEVAATVTVITAEQIEEDMASDIKDLVRFEPGVSVRSAPARFTAAGANTGRDGNAGFNIRGLDGNRVLILVDGVRVPDAFTFGGQSVGRGDYLDLDLLKSVEILRGPTSALYGSDGLAGAVAFTTRDPDDFLSGDKIFAGRARVGYASADESWTGSLLGVAGNDTLSGLLAYTYRDAHETKNKGTNDAQNVTRTTPNPQDFTTHSVLGKLVFQPSDAHRFRLSGEYYDREIVSEVYSARAVLPTTVATATLDLDALDTIKRSRVALDYVYRGEGAIDRALVSLYRQVSESREFAAEDRNTSPDRERLNTFDNAVWGLAAQAESRTRLLGLDHSFVYGFDYSSTRQEGVRDGTQPPVGESYPTRAFPNTDHVLAGLFLQDEVRLLDGRLTVTPAVRYDYYSIDPEVDAAFPFSAASQDDGRFSPKIGAVFWVTDKVGLFGTAAQGYKTPSPSQVNSGFANVVANYQTISNPDLKPETSETVEGGLRVRRIDFAGGVWSGQVTAHASKFDNFIEQVLVSGNYTPASPATFQYVNLASVEISGLEARLESSWGSGLGAQFAWAWTDGRETTGGSSTPLNSVDPWRAVAGLSYRDPEGRFGGRLILTHAAKKAGKDVDQVCGAAGCFTPEAVTLLDLTAYWNLTPAATLRAGLFNLTDETYWWWSDVRGLAANSTVRDAYTAPGRNLSASLTYRF